LKEEIEITLKAQVIRFSSFQFFSSLAAVFAEECGGFTIGQSAKVW
jgi:hypothetical protein